MDDINKTCKLDYETFDAYKAKLMSEKALSDTEYKLALTEIYKYANRGKYEVRIEFTLTGYTRSLLKEKGFIVDDVSSSSRFNHKISWKWNNDMKL